MRKVLSVCLAAVCLLLAAACEKDNRTSLDQEGLTTRTAVSEAPYLSEPSLASPLVSANADNPSQSIDPIIVESSNTISDKEIEAIIDELSAELDSAFSEAESLEELDDSDLDENAIE